MRMAVVVVVGALVSGLTGCAANKPVSAASASPAAARPGTAADSTAPTTTKPPPRPSFPIFLSTTGPVSAARLGPSWHAGCPVAPDALRMLTVRYVGLDSRPHDGELVVAASAVDDLVAIFGALYRMRFP